MRAVTSRFETEDVLKIAGMTMQDYRDAVDRCGYTAPPLVSYARRVWDADDLLCLVWFDALVKQSKAPKTHAGQLASGLRAALQRDPHARKLNLYGWTVGEDARCCFARQRPADAPDAQVILEVPVHWWRANVAAAVDSFYEREAGRRGSETPS
jgi:hypothetical protein